MVQNIKHYLGLTLGLALVWPAIAAAPGHSESGDGYELDMNLIQQLAHSTLIDQVELPAAEDWQEFWQGLEDILHADSVDDLAAAYSGIQCALSYLQAMPAAKPYVTWLRQRQDYSDVARQAQLLYPTKPAAVPKKTLPRGKVRIILPRMPMVELPPPLVQKRNAYLRSQETWTRKLRGRLKPEAAAYLMTPLKSAFETEGVPAAWAWMAEVESGLDPQARSPVGAAGLFQFMPATAKRYGLSLAPQDERLNSDRSAHAAARCLRSLYAQFGSWQLAFAGYNAGDGRVARARAAAPGATFAQIADKLPIETQMYVPKIFATVALREEIDPATLPPPRL